MLHYLALSLAFLQALLPAGMCVCQCEEVLLAVVLGPEPAESQDHEEHECDCCHQVRLAILGCTSEREPPATGWTSAVALPCHSRVFPSPALGLHSPGPPEQRSHLALHVLLI